MSCRHDAESPVNTVVFPTEGHSPLQPQTFTRIRELATM